MYTIIPIHFFCDKQGVSIEPCDYTPIIISISVIIPFRCQFYVFSTTALAWEEDVHLTDVSGISKAAVGARFVVAT